MKPMKPQELYDALIEADIVDPEAQPKKMAAIPAAYLDMSKKLDPTDDEKRMLFEMCLFIVAHNTGNLRADAHGKQVALLMDNPGFEWRPAPETPE